MTESRDNGIATATQHKRVEGLNTKDILVGLLRGRFDKAINIPINDPVLQRCASLQYAFLCSDDLSKALTPMSQLQGGLNRINTTLGALEKEPEGKLSVSTFAKELGGLKDVFKQIEAKRDSEIIGAYENFKKERDAVIKQILEHNLTDDDVAKELARMGGIIDKLEFAFKKFAKEKGIFTTQLIDLDKKALDRLPADKRPQTRLEILEPQDNVPRTQVEGTQLHK
ncbi:MAG: hypothetical protein ACYCQI_09090 [Gammaproteobacteria bacterium]